MAQAKNLVGMVFGKLKVTSKVGKDKFGISLWECDCECGNTTVVRMGSLTSSMTRSCGCLNTQIRIKTHTGNSYAKSHGLSKHYLYQTWATMKQRCENPNHSKYKLYGGRGISVCESWKKSFQQFLIDMGDRPEGHTLNRIDNDGNYCPENCEWQTYSEQNKNRRKYKKICRTSLRKGV